MQFAFDDDFRVRVITGSCTSINKIDSHLKLKARMRTSKDVDVDLWGRTRTKNTKMGH